MSNITLPKRAGSPVRHDIERPNKVPRRGEAPEPLEPVHGVAGASSDADASGTTRPAVPLDHPVPRRELPRATVADVSICSARNAILQALKNAGTAAAFGDAVDAAAAWLTSDGLDSEKLADQERVQAVFNAVVENLPRVCGDDVVALQSLMRHCLDLAEQFGARAKEAAVCRLAAACECLSPSMGFAALDALGDLAAPHSRAVGAGLKALRAALCRRELAQSSKEASAFASVPMEILEHIVFRMLPAHCAWRINQEGLRRGARELMGPALTSKFMRKAALVPITAVHWEYCLSYAHLNSNAKRIFDICKSLLEDYNTIHDRWRTRLFGNPPDLLLDQWVGAAYEINDLGSAETDFELRAFELLLARVTAADLRREEAFSGMSRSAVLMRLVTFILRLNLEGTVRDDFTERLLAAAAGLAPEECAPLFAELICYREADDALALRVLNALDQMGPAGKTARELALIMQSCSRRKDRAEERAWTARQESGPQEEALSEEQFRTALRAIATAQGPFSYGIRLMMSEVYDRVKDREGEDRDIVLRAFARCMEYQSKVFPPSHWLPTVGLPQEALLAAFGMLSPAVQESIVTRRPATIESMHLLQHFVRNTAIPWQTRRFALAWYDAMKGRTLTSRDAETVGGTLDFCADLAQVLEAELR